jgi:hypothetical protein
MYNTHHSIQELNSGKEETANKSVEVDGKRSLEN